MKPLYLPTASPNSARNSALMSPRLRLLKSRKLRLSPKELGWIEPAKQHFADGVCKMRIRQTLSDESGKVALCVAIRHYK
jgi:hypothetical protein